MAAFRYYCLRDDGTIALGENLEASELSEAVRRACQTCQSHPRGAFRFIEVWSGREMLYTSPGAQAGPNHTLAPIAQ